MAFPRTPHRADRRAALALAALLLAAAPGIAAAAEDAEQAARRVMADFLAAFNARDEGAWADTLLFPHVRLASGEVRVYPDREAFLEETDLAQFAARTGWDHSTWDDMRVIQVSPDKVHVAVKFTRYRADGAEIASYDSLYVIERADARWGVRARSSFAP